MSQSDSSSLLAEAQAVSRIVTVQLERVSCLVVRWLNSFMIGWAAFPGLKETPFPTQVLSRETSPTMETGEVPVAAEEEERDERKEDDDEFPAPPSLGDLEELAREQEVPATPKTLRRADSLRQKMAARRIQRTWKHFYQVLASSTYSVQNLTKILETFFTRSSRKRRLTLTTELKLTLSTRSRRGRTPSRTSRSIFELHHRKY